MSDPMDMVIGAAATSQADRDASQQCLTKALQLDADGDPMKKLAMFGGVTRSLYGRAKLNSSPFWANLSAGARVALYWERSRNVLGPNSSQQIYSQKFLAKWIGPIPASSSTSEATP